MRTLMVNLSSIVSKTSPFGITTAVLLNRMLWSIDDGFIFSCFTYCHPFAPKRVKFGQLHAKVIAMKSFFEIFKHWFVRN